MKVVNLVNTPEMEVKTPKEFITEMKECIRNERSIKKDRFKLIVTTIGDREAYLRPMVNIKNLDTVIVMGLSPDQEERIVKEGETLKIKVKQPLRYNLSIPAIEFGTPEEFITEMKECIRNERSIKKDRFKLIVTTIEDKEAYLRPTASVDVLDTIIVRGLNPDQAEEIRSEGNNLGIVVKSALRYSI